MLNFSKCCCVLGRAPSFFILCNGSGAFGLAVSVLRRPLACCVRLRFWAWAAGPRRPWAPTKDESAWRAYRCINFTKKSWSSPLGSTSCAAGRFPSVFSISVFKGEYFLEMNKERALLFFSFCQLVLFCRHNNFGRHRNEVSTPPPEVRFNILTAVQ